MADFFDLLFPFPFPFPFAVDRRPLLDAFASPPPDASEDHSSLARARTHRGGRETSARDVDAATVVIARGDAVDARARARVTSMPRGATGTRARAMDVIAFERAGPSMDARARECGSSSGTPAVRRRRARENERRRARDASTMMVHDTSGNTG
jgi:hypothetical protein